MNYEIAFYIFLAVLILAGMWFEGSPKKITKLNTNTQKEQYNEK